MSKTFKDKPYKFREHELSMFDVEDKPKKPKTKNTVYWWTHFKPSWFVNMFMNRPYRHAEKLWESKIKKISSLEELEEEEEDPLNLGKKPKFDY